MRPRLFCFLLLLLLAPAAIAGETIDEVERYLRLAQSGAPQLALAGLRERSPDIAVDPAGWADGQRAELQILAGQQWWQQLLSQIEGYGESAPAEFMAEVERLRIEALIELNHFQRARELLLQQLWGSADPGEDELKLWRELIVKSYISEGLSDDAYIAMQHFRDDYGIETESSTTLLVQTLFASHFPEIAEGILDKQPTSTENRLLKQLARLRQGKGVRAILFTAKEQLQQNELTPFERSMLWGMVAEAAEVRADKATRVIALEAFLQERGSQKIDALFTIGAEQLWDAYDSYAQSVANREQLLRGDDSAWIASAEAAGKMYPVHRRSIYAYLSRFSSTAAGRIKAQDLLVSSLKELREGGHLISNLYTEMDDGALGQQLISVLLDKALKDRDLERASDLIARMDSPEGEDAQFVWFLRKAKIFMLAANYVQSIEVLDQLIDRLASSSEQNRDRLIQLIFDLQTAHQDIAAVRLLQKIDSQSSDPKLHRELLYWIADSHMALEYYRLAAQGYLESAIVPGVDTMDPWAQTARYQAAKALLKAELKDDASSIYEQLLKHTRNASRRALLKQELEQIHLH